MPKRQEQKDPYALLGVARDADADTIKKAYRKLAQKYHPDRNPGDAEAEEQFKRISNAHAVLSDPERRKNFDEFGEIALDPNFDAERARAASRAFGGDPRSAGGFQDLGGFGSLFEDLFSGGAGAGGRRRASFAQAGQDLETSLTLDFADAVLGSEQRIELQRPDASGAGERQTLTVRIPPGVEEGARIRLAGKGGPGFGGGPPGDLYAKIHVRPHRFLTRDGNDLAMEIPVSIAEAVRGAAVEIPTLDGRVTLRVPPGTDGGSRLRLRGKGVPAHGGRAAGHLYVTIRIRVPKKLSEAQEALVEELFDEDAAAWRAEVLK